MFLAAVFACLALFIFLCLYLTGYIDKVVAWQKKQHERISVLDERISTLEDHEVSQDSRLDRQHAQLKMVKKDVRELGKDVGWGDDLTKTQLNKTVVKPPPDDAA